MNPTKSLIALSVLSLSLGAGQAAQAETVALDFAPPGATVEEPAVPGSSASSAPLAPTAPPVLAESRTDAAENAASAIAPTANNPTAIAPTTPPAPSATALSFAPPPAVPDATPPAAAVPAAPEASNLPATTPIFAGGSDSLVARTVGHAEGTRTADGNKTRAYYGHVDPGNGVWNLGSFSFQHCRDAAYRCASPEAADNHQLRRLQSQATALEQRSQAVGIAMTMEEQLNGIDLANQSPMAALGSPGYVESLRQAYGRGLKGSEAVLWARVQSYWDPQRQRWDAPGLGNTESRITQDQARRQSAIARAMRTYQQQAARRAEVADKPQRELIADHIILQDLSRN